MPLEAICECGLPIRSSTHALNGWVHIRGGTAICPPIKYARPRTTEEPKETQA